MEFYKIYAELGGSASPVQQKYSGIIELHSLTF